MEPPIAAIFHRSEDADRAAAALRAAGVPDGQIRTEVLPRPLYNALAPLGVTEREASLLESRVQGGDVLVRVDGAADRLGVARTLEEHGGLLIGAAGAR